MSPNPALLTWPRPVASGGAWAPTDLAGLVAWWDASDTATITDTSGAVSAWADKSTNEYSLAQASPTKQPTTGATTLNSLNVVTLDGGDDLVSSVAIAQSQPFTIAAVWKDTPGNSRWYASAGNTVQYGSALGIYAGTGFLNGPAYTANTWAYSTHIYNGSSSVARLNGSAGSTGNPGSTNMSGSLWLGSRSGSFYLTGAVAELIVASGALSGTDLTSLETYLADKWGL